MCKVIEDMINDGIKKGKAEERAKLAENLCKIGVPEEQIQKALAL